ncbi:tafazzin [Beauveria brongniartii RCEF 3172]|uniref:Tafazzin n=1 Tax=Beauveria brongniartii RCEF 3172 TaxID=1081107 RepID=A0A162J853_9HYPO|nr:tafazzin [Beauveria brongniartii RCEF 3172]
MPKKRHITYRKSPQALSPSSGAVKDKPQKSVNELLTQLRHTSLASSSTADPAASSPLHANTPTVPPALRHILQIPETPAPRPRRSIRPRFDNDGRRLPAGPPPPRSWTSPAQHQHAAPLLVSKAAASASQNVLANISLPGLQLPAPMSLIGLVFARLAANWPFHRVYDQHYLYDIPCHLKPALMRELAIYSDPGLALGDVKALLLRPSQGDNHNRHGGGVPLPLPIDPEITALDLTGALGRSLTLRDLTAFLFPARSTAPIQDDTQDSWDATEHIPTTRLSHALVPNLTHLSLAISPEKAGNASWRDLLALAPRLGSITHLSLAYWPEPCLLQSAKFATVGSPQGCQIPYGGTNYYSHSIDHDWSEALLVLRKLSRSLYALEFLDLTGCASWWQALKLQDQHDYIDWVNNWGKMTCLRLKMGWALADDAEPSTRAAHREAVQMAAAVERYIITARAGRGRFITVER